MPTVNTALTLKDLPPPPPEKSGWPWTKQSQPLSAQTPDGSEWPRLSVVTPNYNQGQYIEETIRSVLLQGYPNLEYIIIDGGSTDNSIEIIKKYEHYLAYWVSEPDRGQSHAINKGFERCTGDYIAWMNSSDCYMSGAFEYLFMNSKAYRPDFIFGWAAYCGESLNEMRVNYSIHVKKLKLKQLLRFFYSTNYIIPSQSVFASKKIFKQVGFLEEDLHYCMDLDWYARIALVKPSVYSVQNPLCFYRIHDDAKTSTSGNHLREEAIKLAYKYAVHLPQNEQKQLYKLICYAKNLEEYRLGTKKSSINLIKTLAVFPYEALSDKRFLGMFKRGLTPSFFLKK